MKYLNRILASGLIWGCLLLPVAYADTTIVIVRHGEKPAQGLGQLSCQGLNRALALPQVLMSKFGSPVVIYAPNPAIKKSDKGTPYYYVRPLATVEPLAIAAGLPVNLDWGMTDIAQLTEALLARADGMQVVVWEHHLAEKLALSLLKALGGNSQVVPKWDDADFDSVYVIRVAGTGMNRRAIFTRDAEGLNGLSGSCAQ